MKIKYTVADSIPDDEYPITSRKYKPAHRHANRMEQKKYGKSRFRKLDKIITKKVPPRQLAGKHGKNGVIYVHRKVPPVFRGEVAYHEKVEHQRMCK